MVRSSTIRLIWKGARSFVACLTLLQGFSVLAAPACEDVLSEESQSYEERSFNRKADLEALTYSLKKSEPILKDSLMELGTKKEVITHLQMRTESLLNSEGLQFTREPSRLYAHLEYQRYVLTGSPEGSAFAKMIYAAQTGVRFQKIPLKVIFDPLYNLKFDSVAHFNQTEMQLGPLALEHFYSGKIDAARHELQHFFEELKIVNGEPTLARVTLSVGPPSTTVAYSEAFRADEMEAFLRNLRLYRHEGLSFKAGIQDSHFEDGKVIFENMKRFIESSSLSMDYAEAILSKKSLFGSLLPTSDYVLDGERLLVPVLEGSRYQMIEFDLRGLSIQEKSRREMKAEALAVITFSRKRIQAIEKEINELALYFEKDRK